MNLKKILRAVLRVVGVIATAVLILGLGISTAVVSPLVGITLWIVAGTVCVLPLALLIICTIVPQFFCRFLCPMGAMFDIVSWIGRVLRLPKCSARWISDVRYILLLTTLGAIFFSVTSPLILDPTVLFKGFALRSVYSWGWLVLVPVLLIVTLFVPKFWCVRFCPMGALQDLVSFPIRAIKKWRRKWRQKTETTDCSSDSSKTDLHAIAQRRYQWSVAILSVTAAGLFGYKSKQEESKKSSLREPIILPPGSHSELQMASQCARCGACFTVCPTKLIQPISWEQSPILWGVPNVDFQSETEFPAYCEYTCNQCTQVCPTGAIEKIPLEEKQKIVLRPVTLNFSQCRLFFEKECSICITECPTSAIEKHWSEVEYMNILTVNMDLCIGCGKCAAHCPEKALKVES